MRKTQGRDEVFLGIDPAGKSPEEIELEWFENHYQGDIPQLTVRAVLMGSVLGAVMSLSNLYIGLKTGWGIGIAITACILSYSLGAMMEKAGLLRSNLSILENNCMQSTASSAGYSTGSMLVSAIPALLMIRGEHLPFPTLLLWTIFLALLGVVIAIPMKRRMINVEQLRFPSGIAAAQTLRSLYAEGREAAGQARALGVSGVVGAVLVFARDNAFHWWPGGLKIPEMLHFPGSIAGQALARWTVSWEMSLIMVAAGAIIGMRVALSMLLGGLVNYFCLAPMMYEKGVITELGYRGIVSWSLWGGTAVMVTSGLLTFVLQWRTIGRAFAGMAGLFRARRNGGEGGGSGDVADVADAGDARDIGNTKGDGDAGGRGGKSDSPVRNHERLAAMEAIEVPGSWFILGITAATIGVVWIQVESFSISWWMGVLSVFMTFFLSVVACRATGETDITPIGAMGKITQLLYGVAAPAETTTNLMTACVTAGAAASSADLLTDLKSGYLLGANPRRQFLAQLAGIFSGAVTIVSAFYLLVPSAEVLGGDVFPAPGAQVWKGVAELLAKGLESLHVTARWALVIGAAVGIALPLLERVLPARVRPFVPSAMGLGLSFVIPFWNTLSMFVGAAVVWLLSRQARELSDRYTIPVASGIIAGESLMGVLVALMSTLGLMG